MPGSRSPVQFRRSHPYYRRSWRWWVAQQSAWKLVVWGLGVLALSSVVLAALQVLTTASPAGLSGRLLAGAFLTRVLAMFRYITGTDNYPSAPHSGADGLIATAGAVIALFAPAIVIAVVLIRIWSVDAVVWRRRASVCLPWEADDESYRRDKEGTEDGIIAIRFYKRLRGLSISDLRCEAHLRLLEVSPADGTPMLRTLPLRVLGPSGERTWSRTWPISREGTTFTLWIPMDAPLDGGAVRTIQGFNITDSELQTLLVRASGKVTGLGIDVADEHWYSLNKEELQIGRFARVAVDMNRDARSWEGWDRFEEPARQGLFVYGRLVNSKALREFYGHYPRAGVDYVRARISGFRRTWSVATDNTDASRRFVYRDPDSPEAPSVQILFLNLEGSPGSSVEGILLRVDSLMIAGLVGSDGNFLVEDVTGLVQTDKPLAEGMPDIIRTYIGRPGAVAAARAGYANGTAVIEDHFLQEVVEGMHGYDLVLRSVFDAEPLPPVPVVSLLRLPRAQGESAVEGRSAEQG
ncbi:MAG TPA: hypothetical protein VMV92_35060 [Streptosporangiaceae bacterium]|nr:hypothetical protein [Streptosporangiaceae bacterium]HUZ36627.1 hypothetical protein [Streptosporangiaceae bacterium]